MKDQRKKVFLVSLTLLTAGLLFLLYTTEKRLAKIDLPSEKSNPAKKASRSIASTKPVKLKKQVLPAYIEDKLKKNLARQFPKPELLTKWEVTPINKQVRLKNNPYKKFKHVKIGFEYNKKYGSFEALIDPKSGTVLRTWNSIRYEFKRPPMLDIEGRGLASEN